MRFFGRAALAAALVVGFGSGLGCDLLKKKADTKETDDDDDSSSTKKKKKKSDDPAPSASATPTPSAAPSGGDGPMVTIPAGTLKAGYACGAVPRVTDEELLWPNVAMNEFSIDVYPYPNDPAQAAKTSVSRDDASTLCKAKGKRLCTELEWERACKGPDNTTFEYGTSYDKDACKVNASLMPMPGTRAKCGSAFGVKDTHGLAFEWTSSDWGRGKSGLGTVRGSSGADIVRERCAAGKGKAPNESAKDVGFRCCSGPENPAVVDLKIAPQAPLTEDPSVDATLAAAMMRAMPKDHQSVENATVKFDKIWRWHPRDNEELLVGRWAGVTSKKTRFFEVAVFKVCGDTPARIAGMKGPVAKLANVSVGTNIDKASSAVETKSGDAKSDTGTVNLSYWYGSVKLEEPAWVKARNVLPDDPDAKTVTTRPSVVSPKIKVKTR